MKEIRIQTDRRTQLIDITQQVRQALNGGAGSALLVYVPHTTAAVTINEKIDPVLVEDRHRGAECPQLTEGFGVNHHLAAEARR